MAISAFSLCVFLASDHGYLLNVRSQSAKQGLDEEKKTDTLTDLRNISVCLFIFALILFNLFLIFLKGLGEGVHTHTHTSGLKTVVISVRPQYLTVLTLTAQYIHHFILKFNRG